MKVWVLEHHSYGETYIFDEDTDVLKIPLVQSELEALEGAYDDELEEFKTAIAAGRGGRIEERFDIYLEAVRHF